MGTVRGTPSLADTSCLAGCNPAGTAPRELYTERHPTHRHTVCPHEPHQWHRRDGKREAGEAAQDARAGPHNNHQNRSHMSLTSGTAEMASVKPAKPPRMRRRGRTRACHRTMAAMTTRLTGR